MKAAVASVTVGAGAVATGLWMIFPPASLVAVGVLLVWAGLTRFDVGGKR